MSAAVLRRRPLLAHEFTTEYNVYDDDAEVARELCLAKLREEAGAPYTASHEQLLVDLWSYAHPTDVYERVSSKWGILGFQSNDPTRDLRGAGLLSLCHLHRFVSTVGHSFLSEQAPGFSLALASFSVTAMLCRALGLNTSLIFPGCSEHTPSPRVQRNFVELQATGQDVLQRLHARLLLRVSRGWIAMQTPNTTVMDFPILLKATYAHLHAALTVAPRPWQLGSLLAALERERIDAWSVLEARTSPSDICQPFGLYTLLWMICARLACRGQYQAE